MLNIISLSVTPFSATCCSFLYLLLEMKNWAFAILLRNSSCLELSVGQQGYTVYTSSNFLDLSHFLRANNEPVPWSSAQLQDCILVLVLGANSHTAGQDITRLLWNWEVYYRMHRGRHQEPSWSIWLYNLTTYSVSDWEQFTCLIWMY